jgi:hypothetical protein
MSPSDHTSTPPAPGQAAMTQIRAVGWDVVAAQRAILADQLDRLEPDQWDQPSLCRDWRIHLRPVHRTGTLMARGPWIALVAEVNRLAAGS